MNLDNATKSSIALSNPSAYAVVRRLDGGVYAFAGTLAAAVAISVVIGQVKATPVAVVSINDAFIAGLGVSASAQNARLR